MKKVMLVFETRSEVIKMCPLINELEKRKSIQTFVNVTEQHGKRLIWFFKLLMLFLTNGKNVTLGINENSAFSAAYKVNFTLKETGKSATLTVKTLAEKNSTIKLALTAKGKLETGYLNKGVTITPKWTNLAGGADISGNIKVYATAKGAQPIDVTEYFNITPDANSTYLLTFKDTELLEALNPKDKYTVVCEDIVINGQPVAYTKAVSITMALTKAKVEQSTKAVKLYLNDRYSRGEFVLKLKDNTLPDISKVELVENSVSVFYQLIDLGNNKYAIEFKNNEIANKIKAGDLKLNIYLSGNNPENKSPNATVSVKGSNVQFKTTK